MVGACAVYLLITRSGQFACAIFVGHPRPHPNGMRIAPIMCNALPLCGDHGSAACRFDQILEGRPALVDTGATDTFLPAGVLRKLGIQPSARRSYELADGTEQELPIGFGVIEVLGRAAGSTLVFAGETEEPLLGPAVGVGRDGRGTTCNQIVPELAFGRLIFSAIAWSQISYGLMPLVSAGRTRGC